MPIVRCPLCDGTRLVKAVPFRYRKHVRDRAVAMVPCQQHKKQASRSLKYLKRPLSKDFHQDEKALLLSTIADCDGYRDLAAKRLGMPERTFTYLLKSYGLTESRRKTAS